MSEIILHPQNSAQKQEDSNKTQLGIQNNQCKSKKSWWVSSKMKVKGQKYLCKQCEKAFKSPRAVFGHMRCHSHDAKNKKKAKAEVEQVKHPPRKKRSVGRCKINPASSYTSWSNNLNNCSVTLVDEELEDVAVSLLMLANGGFPLLFSDDDDDDDSVKMKTPTPTPTPATPTPTPIIDSAFQQCDIDADIDFANNHATDSAVKVTQQCGIHIVSAAADDDPVTSVLESGSNFIVLRGWFEEKNEECLGLGSGCGQSQSQTKPEDRPRPVPDAEIPSELYDTEMKDEQASCTGVFQVETIHACAENPNNYCEDDIQSGHESDLLDSEIKDAGFEADAMVNNSLSSPKISDLAVEEEKVVDQCNDIDDGHGPTNTIIMDIDNICFKDKDKDKDKEYICNVCSRSFLSHQALGGHRLHCPRKKKVVRARAKPSNISTDTDTNNDIVDLQGGNSKNCTHNCPICCKAFSSGQALGGHMRAHFNAND